MNKIKKTIHHIRLSAGDFKRRVLWHRKPCATILMYHSIDHNKEFFTVSPELFKLQMQYLYDQRYDVISLAQLLDNLKRGKICNKMIAITFDDGYQDNYLDAYPILKSFNFPATIFVATGYIGGLIKARQGTSLPVMSWDMLKELQSSNLVTIEPHTVTHCDISRNDYEKNISEIRDSKEVIENRLGTVCKIFAAPYGRYSQDALSVIHDQGFMGAVTVEQHWVTNHSDAFSLPRQSIDATVSMQRFKNKI